METLEKIAEIVVAVLIAAVILGLLACLLAWPTMLLWNWLMPELFHLSRVTFWQALGLNILAGLLIRGPGSAGSAKKSDK